MATLLDWNLDASSLRQALLQLSPTDLKSACVFKGVNYTNSTMDTVDRLVRASMLENAKCRAVPIPNPTSNPNPKRNSIPIESKQGVKLRNMERMISPLSIPGLGKRRSTSRRPRMGYSGKSNMGNIFTMSNSCLSHLHHGKERTIFSEIELDAIGLSWMNSNTRRNPHSLHVTHDKMDRLHPGTLHSEIVPPILSPTTDDDNIDSIASEEEEEEEEELHFSHILSPKSRTVGVVPWARVSMAPQYHDADEFEGEYIIENEHILEMELNKKVESYGSFEVMSSLLFGFAVHVAFTNITHSHFISDTHPMLNAAAEITFTFLMIMVLICNAYTMIVLSLTYFYVNRYMADREYVMAIIYLKIYANYSQTLVSLFHVMIRKYARKSFYVGLISFIISIGIYLIPLIEDMTRSLSVFSFLGMGLLLIVYTLMMMTNPSRIADKSNAAHRRFLKVMEDKGGLSESR